MEKDKLYERLKAVAEWKLKCDIREALRVIDAKFDSGTPVTGNKTVWDYFQAIEEALFEKYKEKRTQEHVEQFIKSVDSFSQQLEYLKKQPEGDIQ